MILEDIVVVNNPVRPGKGMTVMWRSNADTAYILAAAIGRLVVTDQNTTWYSDIPSGRLTRIEPWFTAPQNVGDYTMVISVFTDDTYTTVVESHTVAFSVANRIYAIDDQATVTANADGFDASGYITLYDGAGNVNDNTISEALMWVPVILRDGVDTGTLIDFIAPNFAANGRYDMYMHVPMFASSGSYRAVVRAYIDDGWPANGQGSRTLLFEKMSDLYVV